jgi:hypothetical protein
MAIPVAGPVGWALVLVHNFSLLVGFTVWLASCACVSHKAPVDSVTGVVLTQASVGQRLKKSRML